MFECNVAILFLNISDILNVSLADVGLRIEIPNRRGILQQSTLFYYHKDHFYILFTLM